VDVFETTHLWKTSLAPQADDEFREHREQLRAAYLSFRKRASLLAAEIARDLPDYTIHDISHSDTLWRMADLITGLQLEITPLEAFVLGGAFLIHDLGMGLAAYPDGIANLTEGDSWRDSIAMLVRRKLGRAPRAEEIDSPDADVAKNATEQVLRDLHARNAERLAMISWPDSDSGESYYLIEDSFLRQGLGRVIGLVAHSHWWPAEQVAVQFNTVVGALAGYPVSWVIDPLKIACLLRISDAAHLDATRAPALLKAVRNPGAGSRDHWLFQQKLRQPILEADRLVYTSTQPFTVEEAQAWWLAFDSLNTLDRELGDVNSILVDCGRSQFIARGVKGAGHASQMCKWVQTDRWTPVDTRIKITDVAGLVRKLGGDQLYGDQKFVPLRELIQNASDAIRARRYHERMSESFGEITVTLGRDLAGYWIEVSDNGIGMSPTVMTGALLDFGTSFWGSATMLNELPGLAATPFQATGKYGIGFFSVFMWSGRVQVTSRDYRDAQRETRVLEFHGGLGTRPVLRDASPSEYLKNGGTAVRVWVDRDPESHDGLLYRPHSRVNEKLEQICAWLCPTLDADLYVRRADAPKQLVVGSSDWKRISPKTLMSRVIDRVELDAAPRSKINRALLIEKLAANLRLIYDSSGKAIGRAAISPFNFPSTMAELGIVTVGGLRACAMAGIAGVLDGTSQTASRDEAIPIVDSAILAKWASEQATLVSNLFEDNEILAECAAAVILCGGHPAALPIAEGHEGWVNVDDIRKSYSGFAEVLLVHDASVHIARRERGAVTLKPNVIAVDPGQMAIVRVRSSLDWPREPLPARWGFHDLTPQGAVMDAVMRAWNKTTEEGLKAWEESTDERSIRRTIGTAGGKSFRTEVDVLKNSGRRKRKG
jgi:hypothetical protein